MKDKTKEFLNKIKLKRLDKAKIYDYSKVNYKNNKTKIIIICKKHGEFLQRPDKHLSGSCCPECSKSRDNLKSSTERFINKSKMVHGNKYDYSVTEYESSKEKVEIICPTHGKFSQLPHNHYAGKGCPKCIDYHGSTSRNKYRNLPKNKFEVHNYFDRASTIHNNKYFYDIKSYKNRNFKIRIICPHHGEFWQKPGDHICGKGCPKCSRNKKLTNNEFINRSKKLYDDYTYSKTRYDGYYNKVTITCKKHGDFEVRAGNHLYLKSGCPRCVNSISMQQQDIIDYIKGLYGGKILINDRMIIGPLELDVYIPDLKLAFEYHGLYWHSFDMSHKVSEEEKNKHQIKYLRCVDKNILLIQIMEHEWINNTEEIKRRISCYIDRIDFDNRKIINLRYPLLEMKDYKIYKPRYNVICGRKFWDAGKAIRE